MNKQERYDYYNSGKLQPVVQVCLLDWLNYWSAPGAPAPSDPLLKAQTDEAVRLLLVDLEGMTRKVSELAMGESAVKDADPEPTESNIEYAVTVIMSNRLKWLTGIESVPQEE